MRKDPTEFRERFQRWKKGEQVYENGLALPAYEDGKDPLKYEKAFYNAIDPRQGFPESKTDAVLMQARVWNKYLSGDNTRDYDLEPELADSVSDAAFRKRLGLPYDKKFLPVWNGDTVRLPKPLEAEIPTDTTIAANVGITIGDDTTIYPLVNSNCTNASACRISERGIYPVVVRTNIQSGVFKLLENLNCCNSCGAAAPSLPIPTTGTQTTGGEG